MSTSMPGNRYQVALFGQERPRMAAFLAVLLLCWSGWARSADDKPTLAEPPIAEVPVEASAEDSAAASVASNSEESNPAVAAESTPGANAGAGAEAPAAESIATEKTSVSGAESSTDAPATPSAESVRDQESASPSGERKPVTFITDVKYLSKDRPAWLESLPTHEGRTYIVPVRAGPFRSLRDCESDLEVQARMAVDDLVNEQLKAPHAANFITFSLDDLRRRNVVREQFTEQLETSVGLMNQAHAKLVFDDEFRDEIDSRWSEIRAKSRLAQTGLGAGIVFLLLGTLFSYFRIDTATKGYYTRRLQFVAAGTILALVAASILLTKLIPWM